MNYWLMKSEPDVFSIDDLRKRGAAGWDGVRNYQARNFMRAMRRGDPAFFYHSNAHPPSVVGVMEILREAHPDPTQFDPAHSGYDPGASRERPRWDQVEVQFRRRLAHPLALDKIRRTPALQSMSLLKRPRLSVQPVSETEWNIILALTEKK